MENPTTRPGATVKPSAASSDRSNTGMMTSLKRRRPNVTRLTKTHEATQPVPWKMGDAPREYIDQMVKAIVGIEIEVTRLVGKLKLSQNKEAPDIAGAGQALTDGGDAVMGAAMLEQAARK